MAFPCLFRLASMPPCWLGPCWLNHLRDLELHLEFWLRVGKVGNPQHFLYSSAVPSQQRTAMVSDTFCSNAGWSLLWPLCRLGRHVCCLAFKIWAVPSGQELLGVVQLLEKKRRAADGSTQPSDGPRFVLFLRSTALNSCYSSMQIAKVSFFLMSSTFLTSCEILRQTEMWHGRVIAYLSAYSTTFMSIWYNTKSQWFVQEKAKGL